MLKVVDGKSVRPTKSDMERINRLFERYKQPMPARWTEQSLAQALRRAKILADLDGLLTGHEQEPADAPKQPIRNAIPFKREAKSSPAEFLGRQLELFDFPAAQKSAC